ncbi:MAG: hypothetical protein WCO58_00035 [bacterium]
MKKLLEDIVRPEHEIHIDAGHTHPSLSHEIIQTIGRDKILTPEKKHLSPRFFLWIVVLLLLVWSVIAILHSFREATIVIDPFVQKFDLKDAIFSGQKSGGGDELKYEIIQIKNEVTTTLEGTKNTSNTATFAKGAITFTNTDTKQKVTLVQGTTFVDTNGNEYELTGKLVIPVAKKVKTDIVPSKTTGTIKAKELGSKYNAENLLLNFKDTKLQKPTLSLSQVTMKDGKDTGAYQVTGEVLQKTYTELDQKLREKLYIQAQAQLPEGFIIFRNGGTYTISNFNPVVTGADQTVPVTLQGSASFFIFERKNLEKTIAGSIGIKDDESTYMIPKLTDLDIKYLSMTDINSATVAISGEGLIIWRIDDRDIKQKILGAQKNNLKNILKEVKSIANINIKMTPFWEQNLPDKSDKITIIVNNPIDGK